MNTLYQQLQRHYPMELNTQSVEELYNDLVASDDRRRNDLLRILDPATVKGMRSKIVPDRTKLVKTPFLHVLGGSCSLDGPFGAVQLQGRYMATCRNHNHSPAMQGLITLHGLRRSLKKEIKQAGLVLQPFGGADTLDLLTVHAADAMYLQPALMQGLKLTALFDISFEEVIQSPAFAKARKLAGRWPQH
ncbi:MAG: hypothetical protein LC114_04285 [Bryobacterales bacterium]|nr:hypothetical protein [Bryobacterales bacterium]